MYLGLFKLAEMPFRLAPDPRFMYWSAGHAAALECLRPVHAAPNGCTIITGERGAGKTALLDYLRQQSPSGTMVRVDIPPRTLAEFKERIEVLDAADALSGNRMVVCDNAHLFHESMLATVLQRDFAPPGDVARTRVILSGEPTLLRTLEAPQLAAQAGKACDRFHLPPLAADETPAYIAHRVTVAGGNAARIFGAETCAEIHRETRGNPRLVNALCDAALMVACERELSRVGSAEVRRALDDIGGLIAMQSSAPPPAALATIVEPPAAASRPVLARVRIMHGERQVFEHELTQGRLSIGRGTDNDLCIDSKFISRHHCRIVTSAHKCLLEDVHSTNGLFVNDRRVRHHLMRHGDVVQIGEHRLHYADLRQNADQA